MKSNNTKKIISSQKKQTSNSKNTRPQTARIDEEIAEDNEKNDVEQMNIQAVSDHYFRKSTVQVDRVSREASQEKNEPPEEIRISWKLFEKSANLGQGAFGDVLKIKCLKSTCLHKDGTCRVVMNNHTIRRAKQARHKAELAAGRNAAISNDYEKSMFQDEYYVAKTINVAHLSQKAQFEALNEIETMQTLNSPYIVGYYDSFIDEELSEPQINIIIEYCAGGDLSSFLEKQERLMSATPHQKYLNENLVWRIFINLCIGLEHMHSRDFIHRDLKTLNIFMTRDNVAKIGDLGCALNLQKHRMKMEQKMMDKQRQKSMKKDGADRIMEDIEPSESMINDKSLNDSMLLRSLKSTFEKHSKVRPGDESSMTDDNPVGTPYYLAPEIWREKKYSKESDIWALGVILYELLHYRKPFPANDKDELIEKVYNKPFNKIRSGISTPLQHLINIMLKKDPGKRPSVEEIIMSDEFQTMSLKQKINLPLQLNKQKILQKIATDSLGDLNLTPFQRALFEKEIKRAQKVIQKVEKQSTVTKKQSSNQLVQQQSRVTQLSKKGSQTEMNQGANALIMKQKSAKLTKNNSRINQSKNTLMDGPNNQLYGKQKIPKLNLNQIKFSENLKGVAEIQVIEQTQNQRESSKNEKNGTSRSPKSKVRKSVEVRKNVTDRNDSRFAIKRNQSKKEEMSAVAQYRSKNQFNQSGSLVGTKSDVFSSRRQSVNHSKGKSKIDLQGAAVKGHDTDRGVRDSAKKSDYYQSNQKSQTMKNSAQPSRHSSPKQGAIFGSNSKTIFAMKVPSHFQQSSSKVALSKHRKSIQSQKQSPVSNYKHSRKNSQTFNVDEVLFKRRNTEKAGRELMKYSRMDIEDSVQFSKANETILTHINDQLRDTNSRNLVHPSATVKVEERMDLITNDFASNNSTSSKGGTRGGGVVMSRKYVSMRHNREEVKNTLNSQEEPQQPGNKTHSIINNEKMEALSHGMGGSAGTQQGTITALTKRKMVNKHRAGTFQQLPSSIQQNKVTNMNVDKRKYLSKYTEAQTATDIQQKSIKKSVTPEMYSDQNRKFQSKPHARKDSVQALNKYELSRNKRTESVFYNNNKEISVTISPKIMQKQKVSELIDKPATMASKQQLITPIRKVPAASTLYQKPFMQKKRSAGLNGGGVIKDKPQSKQAISKIRSSAKVTSTYDEKYSKRIGQKKGSNQSSILGSKVQSHNYTDYNIHHSRHDPILKDQQPTPDDLHKKNSYQNTRRQKLVAQSKSDVTGSNNKNTSSLVHKSVAGKTAARPSSNSSKLSMKNPPAVSGKQDTFKPVTVDHHPQAAKRIPVKENQKRISNDKNQVEASFGSLPVRQVQDDLLAVDEGSTIFNDEKKLEPQIIRQEKHDQNDIEQAQQKRQQVNKLLMLDSPSQEPHPGWMPDATAPSLIPGNSKPPLSIMIDKELADDDVAQGNAKMKYRAMTPGGYLLYDAEEPVDELPESMKAATAVKAASQTQLLGQGIKTPNEGTKRLSRKTFQAFQKFKNAFKNPKSNRLSSLYDSQPGSKSGTDNMNGEFPIPKLEQSDSPDQLRSKPRNDSFSVTDFNNNGTDEQNNLGQQDDILKTTPKNRELVQKKAEQIGDDNMANDNNVDNQFIFKAMSDSDQEKEEEEDSKSLTFPREDLELTRLQQMSHVSEDGLQFDKVA